MIFGILVAACSEKAGDDALSDAEPAGASSAVSKSPRVDHGELDTETPDDSPKLAATVVAATIYKLPNKESRRLGYLRVGSVVSRDSQPVKGEGCEEDWYRIYPMGHVCMEEATTDLDKPLVRAANTPPDLAKPLPYAYGFVRATAPQYLRVPTADEQLKHEFKLAEHLKTFQEKFDEWQTVDIGANDIPLDRRGVARRGLRHRETYKTSSQMNLNEIFGGGKDDSQLPWWLEGGRKIPNISGFAVPDYAVFADRVRRHTGLSFVDAFKAVHKGIERRFGVTVDLRLVPTTKVKPDTGSAWHGVELTEKFPFPFAFVIKKDTKLWKLIKGKDEARGAEAVPHRSIVPLSGKARVKAGRRFYQTLRNKTRWLQGSDLGVVVKPQRWPESALKGEKWIDISLRQQTVVLYEGKRPWYATLVSTGRDRLGDPEKSLATPQGEFRLKSKHIAAAMDSEENTKVIGGARTGRRKTWSAEAQATIDRLKKAEKAGTRLSEDDRRRLLNIKKGRHPEYGVTMRRGAGDFELRDVPWIQYFASGYAIHGAYWHDVFGIPRSHGCVNLSPIDARIAFMWTDPPVPNGWHGVNIGPDMGMGTLVSVHE